ncbi:MAG: TonB-dependent receptor [Prevotella sp.]|nr:TonB-dependent receptor [Prevotella sp.]
MNSKNCQLMLLAGALTVSFVAKAAEDNKPVAGDVLPVAIEKNTDANVYGHVINKSSGEHLPFVTIQLKGTTIVTTTDHTGHYFLKNLPEGTFTVVVKMVGYKTQEKKVAIKHDATQELNFALASDDVDLDEVVVSANRNETQRRLAPNLVNVIGGKLFDITQSTCLAQGLNFQPGVRTEDNCQNCGFTQVRINGLDGHYSQILVDSRPVFSSLNGVYGLEQIPANMIDRVEVVRGGGSALFGASAIGGTINIITKEPIRNSASFGHTFMSQGGSNSFDNVTTGNVSLVTDDNKAGIYAYGQTRTRQGYDYDGDGYTELPELNNQTFGLNSYLRLSPYSKLSLQYHGIHEFRRGGNKLDQAPHEANIAEQAEHNIQGGGLTYNFYSPDEKNRLSAYFSFQTTARKSYYGGIGEGTDEDIETAENAYGTTHNFTYVAGTQYVHSFDKLLFMPSDLILGAEYSYDGIKDVILGYDRNFKQDVRIGSFFFQNEWKNKQWSFLLGGRLDKHNLVDHVIFSPRANLRFNPTENVNLRITYAGGFRAPQAFDEDLHVGVVGGERLVTVLAKNLKEERSNSFSVSADLYHKFGNVQTNLLIEGFYTDLNNVFALRQLDQPDAQDNTVQERYNAYGAKVLGLNIEGKAMFTRWFSLQAGLTLQQSHYDEAIAWNDEVPEQKYMKMMRTPNTYGYFTASFTPVKRFTASVTGNYTGSMLVGHSAGSGVEEPVAVNTPKFMEVNMKLSYDFPIYKYLTLQVNGGIQNITNAYQKDFDKGWNRDSNYIYGPSLPRSYYVGVKISY